MFRLFIPLGLLLLVDVYFFQAFKTVGNDLPSKWRIMLFVGYWLISFLTLVGILFGSLRDSWPNHIRYYLFSFILVLFIPKLIGVFILLGEDLFRMGKGVIGIFASSEDTFLSDRRKFISQASLIAAAIPFATMLYGMARTAFNIQVKKKTVFYDDLPISFDGLKIAQISDLHSGSFSSSDFFAEAVDQILALKPDLIFFTGDLVNNEAVEAEPHIHEFKRLKARLGVYSILGNHDYGDYGPWPSQQAKAANLIRLKEIHKDSGWNLLLNSNHVLNVEGQKLAIIGVENWGASRHFPKYGDLDKAVLGVEDIPFKILLSHDPSHWDAKIKAHPQKFQLTLSGHTHGAQFGIEIPGIKWSPVQYLYKQWAGLYEESGQNIYVNRGLGFIGYMGRIGISPEITLLELKSSKNI
ncbi:MAG: metallophosphoesterase [Flavobacteriales bacterium]|nr:metallophosphoesterase [Flavobacteriales bacterium]